MQAQGAQRQHRRRSSSTCRAACGLPTAAAATRHAHRARARGRARSRSSSWAPSFRTELVTFGESVARGDVNQLAAEARRSDLSGALAVAGRSLSRPAARRHRRAVGRRRHRGDRRRARRGRSNVPVFAVGVGDPKTARDREVINVTAGEPLLSDSSIDLSVSAVSHGLRHRADRDPGDRERPADRRAPCHAVRRRRAGSRGVHRVAVADSRHGLHRRDSGRAPGELAAENNVRRVLVPPQGRTRRVLVVEGAPGFEHTFLKRALARDAGARSRLGRAQGTERRGARHVLRPGRREPLGGARRRAIRSSAPSSSSTTRSSSATSKATSSRRDQLEMTADFVVGARRRPARARRAIVRARRPGRHAARRSAAARFHRSALAAGAGVAAAMAPRRPTRSSLTTDGATHPATRLAVSIDESRKRWAQLPPMASTVAVGAPRPGAQVLAVTTGVGRRSAPGDRHAALRPGPVDGLRRRSVVALAHDAAVDRQHVRAGVAAAGALAGVGRGGSHRDSRRRRSTLPGTTETLSVLVRNEEFKPIGDAEVVLRVKEPGGQERTCQRGAVGSAAGPLLGGRPLRSAGRLRDRGRT